MVDDQYLTDLRNKLELLRQPGDPNKAAADAVQAEIDDYEQSLKTKKPKTDLKEPADKV